MANLGLSGAYSAGPHQSIAVPTVKSRSVVGAAVSIEDLNGRLGAVVSALRGLSSQLSSEGYASGPAGEPVSATGVVDRLNDGALSCHQKVGDIEDLIRSINRHIDA